MSSQSPENHLPDRHLAFIDHYTGDDLFNGTQSAIHAGYSENGADVTASRLLGNPRIREEIDKRLKAHHLSSDEVLARLADLASATIEPFVNIDGHIDLANPSARRYMRWLKGVKVKTLNRTSDDEETTETVETSIDLHDAMAALVHVGRYHKLFTDKIMIDDSQFEEYLNRLIAQRAQFDPRSEIKQIESQTQDILGQDFQTQDEPSLQTQDGLHKAEVTQDEMRDPGSVT